MGSRATGSTSRGKVRQGEGCGKMEEDGGLGCCRTRRNNQGNATHVFKANQGAACGSSASVGRPCQQKRKVRITTSNAAEKKVDHSSMSTSNYLAFPYDPSAWTPNSVKLRRRGLRIESQAGGVQQIAGKHISGCYTQTVSQNTSKYNNQVQALFLQTCGHRSIKGSRWRCNASNQHLIVTA